MATTVWKLAGIRVLFREGIANPSFCFDTAGLH
jgi:hypothetical protein